MLSEARQRLTSLVSPLAGRGNTLTNERAGLGVDDLRVESDAVAPDVKGVVVDDTSPSSELGERLLNASAVVASGERVDMNINSVIRDEL